MAKQRSGGGAGAAPLTAFFRKLGDPGGPIKRPAETPEHVAPTAVQPPPSKRGRSDSGAPVTGLPVAVVPVAVVAVLPVVAATALPVSHAAAMGDAATTAGPADVAAATDHLEVLEVLDVDVEVETRKRKSTPPTESSTAAQQGTPEPAADDTSPTQEKRRRSGRHTTTKGGMVTALELAAPAPAPAPAAPTSTPRPEDEVWECDVCKKISTFAIATACETRHRDDAAATQPAAAAAAAPAVKRKPGRPKKGTKPPPALAQTTAAAGAASSSSGAVSRKTSAGKGKLKAPLALAPEPGTKVNGKGKGAAPPTPPIAAQEKKKPTQLASIFMSKAGQLKALKERREEAAKLTLRAEIGKVKEWDSAVNAALGKTEVKELKLVSQVNRLGCSKGASAATTPTPFPTGSMCHVTQLPSPLAADTAASASVRPFELRAETTPTAEVPAADPVDNGCNLTALSKPFVRTELPPAQLPQRAVREAISVETAKQVGDLTDEATALYARHYHPRGVNPGDCVREGAALQMLWTERYAPTASEDLIGNAKSVKALRTWLCEWKTQLSLDANKGAGPSKAMDEDEVAGSESDPNSDDDDFVSPRGGGRRVARRRSTRAPPTQPPPPTMALLIGPPGSCKTAAVAACAAELGYQILELHAGQQRTGKIILGTLREATQSHSMSTSARSVDDTGGAAAAMFAALPPRKRQSQFADGIIYTTDDDETPTDAAVSLECPVADLVQQNVGRYPGLKAKSLLKAGTQLVYTPLEGVGERPMGGTGTADQDGGPAVAEVVAPSTGLALDASLIVIEDVDLAFESDLGYWKALENLIATTKKPIVLTTSCLSADRPIFRSPCHVLQFRRPPASTLLRHTRLLCMAEGLAVCSADLSKLIAYKNRDVRATICALQQWSSRPDMTTHGALFQQLVAPQHNPLSTLECRMASRCSVDSAQISDEDTSDVTARCVVELDALAAMLDTLSYTDWGLASAGTSDGLDGQGKHDPMNQLTRQLRDAAVTACEMSLEGGAEHRQASVLAVLDCVNETAEMEADFWKGRDSLGAEAAGCAAEEEPDSGRESSSDDVAAAMDVENGGAAGCGSTRLAARDRDPFFAGLGLLCRAPTMRAIEPVGLDTVAERNAAALSKAMGSSAGARRDHLALDVLPAVRQILVSEEVRRDGARRFCHYLSNSDIGERHFKLIGDGFNSESNASTPLDRPWSAVGVGSPRFPCACPACSQKSD